MLQLATEWLPIAAAVVYGLSLPFGLWLVAEARRAQVSDRAGPPAESGREE